MNKNWEGEGGGNICFCFNQNQNKTRTLQIVNIYKSERKFVFRYYGIQVFFIAI